MPAGADVTQEAEPGTEVVPALQVVQTLAPNTLEYLPASQVVQAVALPRP